MRVELDAINTERELGAGREWHLRPAEELSAQMERSAVEDVLVEAGGGTEAAVAREVLKRTRMAAAAGGLRASGA